MISSETSTTDGGAMSSLGSLCVDAKQRMIDTQVYEALNEISIRTKHPLGQPRPLGFKALRSGPSDEEESRRSSSKRGV